jgi:hypothetical protein
VNHSEKDYSLDPTKAYSVTTQLNAVLSSLLSRIERHALDIWAVHCVRPNDSGLSNSFDRRRARLQVRSLGLVDLVGNKQRNWAIGYVFLEFRNIVGMGSMTGSSEDAVRTFTGGERWKEGNDFVLGKSHVWLNWNAWRDVDYRLVLPKTLCASHLLQGAMGKKMTRSLERVVHLVNSMDGRECRDRRRKEEHWRYEVWVIT